MEKYRIRKMETADRYEVADLICVSTNVWYMTNGASAIFPTSEAADVFWQVYETLDPGMGIVAESERTGRLMGSCFIHPRETHISLGIMNVHPNYFGNGVARGLLTHITDLADREGKPVRLVSSAMNLDSYSLYNRAGFLPQKAFQDMYVPVPEKGLKVEYDGLDAVREGTLDDLDAICALDMELVGIDRRKDFDYFLKNEPGFWHVSVLDGEGGKLNGFMASSGHSGSNMIGPGLSRTPQQAVALTLAELKRYPGRTPVLLAPVRCPELVQQMYALGGKNCEMHYAQIRGEAKPIEGIFMPTFLPESA